MVRPREVAAHPAIEGPRHPPHRRPTDALLACEGAWRLRSWSVADGAGRDEPAPAGAIAAARPDPGYPHIIEIAGQRVCGVDGWIYQGPACQGLTRYNARSGAYEPVP